MRGSTTQGNPGDPKPPAGRTRALTGGLGGARLHSNLSNLKKDYSELVPFDNGYGFEMFHRMEKKIKNYIIMVKTIQ